MSNHLQIVKPGFWYTKSWFAAGFVCALYVYFACSNVVVRCAVVLFAVVGCIAPIIILARSNKQAAVEFSSSSIAFCSDSEMTSIDYDDIFQMNFENHVSGRLSREFWVFITQSSQQPVTVSPPGDFVDRERIYKLLLKRLAKQVNEKLSVQKVSKTLVEGNLVTTNTVELSPGQSPYFASALVVALPYVLMLSVFFAGFRTLR